MQASKRAGGKEVCGKREIRARPWGEKRRLGGKYVEFYTHSGDGFWSHL